MNVMRNFNAQTKTIKVITILGTRPEIIKLSPLLPFLDREFNHLLIHTGQHYDHNMDEIFFQELQLRKPDFKLNVVSHPHGQQTGLMLEKIEPILMQEKPDLVIVQGDTNTTLAGALAAAKLFIPVMHVESGCRSFSKELPEEINKTLVPYLSEFLIAPDEICRNNLLKGGLSQEKIFQVGSTVGDAVERNKNLINPKILVDLKLEKEPFLLVTLHRAENTNNPERLQEMLEAINDLAELSTVVFPLHPRTKKALQEYEIKLSPKIKTTEPLSYLNFLALLSHCTFSLSDSGGVQEEAAALNVPCLILRNETEWTRLTEVGKNILVGTKKEKIVTFARNLLLNPLQIKKMKEIPSPFPKAVSAQIVKIIQEKLQEKIQDKPQEKHPEKTQGNIQKH